MTRERDSRDDVGTEPADERRETAESQGQAPKTGGAPLVTEEGVDEGVAELAEEGRPRRKGTD